MVCSDRLLHYRAADRRSKRAKGRTRLMAVWCAVMSGALRLTVPGRKRSVTLHLCTAICCEVLEVGSWES